MSNPRSPTSPRMPATMRRPSYASVAAGTQPSSGTASQQNTGGRPNITAGPGQAARRAGQVIDSGDEEDTGTPGNPAELDTEEDEENDDDDDDDEQDYEEEDEDEGIDEEEQDPVVELTGVSGGPQSHWDATIPNTWRHTRHHHRSTVSHDRSGLGVLTATKPTLPQKELRPSYLRNTKYMESLDQHYSKGQFSEAARLEDSHAPMGVAVPATAEGQVKWSGQMSVESGPLFLGGTQRSHRGASYSVIERPPRFQEPPAIDPTGFVEPPVALLPTYFWEFKKTHELDISSDGLSISYTQPSPPSTRSVNHGHSCRANAPIPTACGLYYFEVTIMHRPSDALIAIGITSNDSHPEKVPGYETGSWGFHGDSGLTYNFMDSSGKRYGESFKTGDIIGCGVNLVEGSIFFTQNGKNLGEAFKDLGEVEKLYPCIGIKKSGSVEVNFGASLFRYDIDAEMERVRATVRERKAKADVSKLLGKDMDITTLTRDVVAQYLKHGGYVESAKAFSEDVKKMLSASEPFEKIMNVGDREDSKRQEIRAFILDGNIDRAVDEIENKFSTVLKDHPKVMFHLRCQKWVEMMRKTSENFALNKQSSKPTSPAFIPGKLLALQSLNTSISEQPFTAAQKQKTPARFSPTFMEPPPNLGVDNDTNMDLDASVPDSRAVSPWGSPSASMRSERYMNEAERESFEKARLYAEELNHDYEDSTDEEIKAALSDIFILFAMDLADDSPVVKSLMDEKARVKVAEMVDEAILVHLNQNPRSALEDMARQTDVLLDEISAWKSPGAFVNLKNDILGSHAVVGTRKREKSD